MSRVRTVVVSVALAALVNVAGGASAQVLLNEILADPAGDWDGDGEVHSRDDEWVEIVNAGPDPVDLGAYRLAGEEMAWRYGFHGVLHPGAVRVVYGSQSYVWEQETGNPAFGLRLTNTGGSAALWRLSASDTVMVDCYVYADHEADDDRSAGRIPDGGSEWFVFDGINPYDGTTEPLGSGCTPTPGATISCPTPVETSTWGGIKQMLPVR